jgi:hypothetical protein
MMRRVPPLRYQSTEGRLVDYTANMAATDNLPTNVFAFSLFKTYIPWSTWDDFEEGGAPRLPSTPPHVVSGTYAMKTLPKEHERTLEDITTRLREETRVVQEEGWIFPAYERHFRYLSPALMDAFNDIVPYLADSAAYQWDKIKNMLVSYIDSSGLDYPRLNDPTYFEARRLDALNVWQILDCVAQTMAAKWELGFGECQDNPNPDDFHLPDTDRALEIGGWMMSHYPSLRGVEQELPMVRFVEAHRRDLQPQQFIQNASEFGQRFTPAATPDLFGQVWAQRFGYDALLTDLESALATPEQLLGLGWLYDQRDMR